MTFARFINLFPILQRKSCFLLGPRQTGKSWFIRKQFSNHKIYNLLELDTFRTLSSNPSRIRHEVREEERLIVIDEIQRLPELLNEVHLLIEEQGKRFLLTGSSARKLRRAGVNLLGGRASWKMFHPLIRQEIGQSFDLQRALCRGLLPSIYTSDDYRSDLKDYVEIYLREEIASETAIRNLPAYSRFLDVAALCNARLVNYTQIANDAQLSPTTVREYFEVLKDTLLIHRLPAWRESKKRKATAHDKFYFFDIGVARYLQGRIDLAEHSSDFGDAFETYIFHELMAYSSYRNAVRLSYWRTISGFEVDFLIDEHTAIEVKATRNVHEKHLKGLCKLREEGVFKRYILVSLDQRARMLDGIELLPVTQFLDELWA